MNYQTKINILLSFWTAAMIFLIVVAVMRLWTPALRAILCLAVAPGGFLLVWFIPALILKKTVGKITALLFDQCDTDKFLNAVYAAAPPVKAGKSPAHIWVMLTYEGLYAAGRYDEALAELHKLTQFKNSRLGAHQQAAWLIDLAEVSIALGQTAAAEHALADCLNMLENREIARKVQQLLYTAYRNETCKLNIVLGHTDGAEAILAERFEQAKNEYERVGAKYHLGQLYRLTGEDEKAKEAFEYVAAHGNRLYFAALAREQLGLEPQPSVARLWKQEAPAVPTV